MGFLKLHWLDVVCIPEGGSVETRPQLLLQAVDIFTCTFDATSGRQNWCCFYGAALIGLDLTALQGAHSKKKNKISVRLNTCLWKSAYVLSQEATVYQLRVSVPTTAFPMTVCRTWAGMEEVERIRQMSKYVVFLHFWVDCLTNCSVVADPQEVFQHGGIKNLSVATVWQTK